MSDYELYHHGIKGMKWGIRRYQREDGTLTAAGRKRQAKEDYKAAKSLASARFRDARKNADSKYERDLSERNAALDKVKKTYDKKDSATEKYYQSKISKHQRDADAAKEDMDFWDNPNSDLYKEAFSRYEESTRLVRDLEVRRDTIVMANKLERDNATIKVRELYSDIAKKASDDRAIAYTKAAKEYMNDVKSAKKEYKKAKK